MKLWDFLKSNMLLHKEQLVCENNAQMTFEDLVCWAELFAERLKGLKCCAVLCGSEMAAGMALLACFAAGVTTVPLSMRYGELHCEKILNTISPDAIITDDDGDFKIRRIPGSQYTVPDQHPALIMCTSGTTGTPKGAMLSETNIITNVTDISSYFGIVEMDTILISRPLYHCAVLSGEFLTALIKGVKIRFYSEQFNPSKMIELIQNFKVTAFCGTPTLLGMMSRFKKKSERDTLRHICVSGECMEADLGLRIADAFPNCDIYHIYGLTEASPRVSYLPPNLFRKYPDFVGIPLKSVSIKILNKEGMLCRFGEEGILWIKGNNVMIGYYRDPANTEKVLKNGWLCTGDIALMNNEGLLKIKGRNDHLIIKSGMNIYPAEVEAALRQSPLVKEVLIYGFKNRFGTQIGMKIAGNFSSVEEVKRLCVEFLPGFQVPALIEIVSELPKNGSGKIIRPGI